MMFPSVCSEDDESSLTTHDSSDEFSSSEFEKLDVIPLSHSVGGIDLEDSDSKLIPSGEEVFEEEAKGDDQGACKQTVDGTHSDRKPDEGESDSGSRTQGTSTSASATVTLQSITASHPSHETSPSTTTRATDADVVQEVVDLNNQKSGEKTERSSDSKSRSKTDSHKSDRRDKSSSSSSRKDKRRSDRDRDRDRDRGRDKDKERSRYKDRERSVQKDIPVTRSLSTRASNTSLTGQIVKSPRNLLSHKSDRNRSKERHRDRVRDRDRE
jgi:hypothetical protein